MNNRIVELEKELMKKDVPRFDVGDTVKVLVKIKEGDKTRLQAFEGVVISKKGSGIREVFTVRRLSYGEGAERIFQLHSPLLDNISVVKKGSVRRSKLYYLKKRIGKHTKIEEERISADNKNNKNAPLGEKGIS